MKKITSPLMFLMLCGILHLNAQIKNEEKIFNQGKEKIVYLFFTIDKNTDEKERIQLEENKTVYGKLKSKPSFSEKDIRSGDLVISLSNKSGREIFKYNLKDPLNPVMESFGSTMENNKIALKKAEFSIRYPYSDEIEMVKIEKITDSDHQLIFTQKL